MIILIYGFNLTRQPMGILLNGWVFTIFLIGGSRLAFRLVDTHWKVFSQGARQTVRILIVGAGDAGERIVRELLRQESYVPVGFVDDDPEKQGVMIQGVAVLGTTQDIPRICQENNIDQILIAIPSAKGSKIREVVSRCEGTTAHLRILPSLHELIDGDVTPDRIRDVQVEDLLHRPPVEADMEEVAHYLRGKRVLVTGAGGSIGSELCRQIARIDPAVLLLMGHGENSIFDIERELAKLNCPIVPVIGDIKDRNKVEIIFQRYAPEVVFHAAAHKHVPLMEMNPDEAIKNNILGTKNLADMAAKYGTGRFVLVSTDKAVNPTSIMGATKRVAEMIVQNKTKAAKTIFVAVRFGNVLGSRGSIVPVVMKQIAQGGPVTITHPDMERYFMTIPEAVQLIIQAGAMGSHGEIFVLDMGEPVRIMDLVKNLIRLCGFIPDRDIKIDTIGIRPGEKLYEEMLTSEEGTRATQHQRIFIAPNNHHEIPGFYEYIEELERLATLGDGERIKKVLKQLIPAYRPYPPTSPGPESLLQSLKAATAQDR